MTSDGTHGYRWDARDQLKQIDGGFDYKFQLRSLRAANEQDHP